MPNQADGEKSQVAAGLLYQIEALFIILLCKTLSLKARLITSQFTSVWITAHCYLYWLDQFKVFLEDNVLFYLLFWNATTYFKNYSSKPRLVSAHFTSSSCKFHASIDITFKNLMFCDIFGNITDKTIMSLAINFHMETFVRQQACPIDNTMGYSIWNPYTPFWRH